MFCPYGNTISRWCRAADYLRAQPVRPVLAVDADRSQPTRDALPGLVWAMDADGRAGIRQWPLARIHRPDFHEQLLGEGWRSAVHARLASSSGHVGRDSFLQGAGEIEVRRWRFDGEHRWFARFSLLARLIEMVQDRFLSGAKKAGRCDRRLQRLFVGLSLPPVRFLARRPLGWV